MIGHRIRGLTLVAALMIPVALAAQEKQPLPPPPKLADPWAPLLRPTTHKPTPTTAAITPADLMTRLFAFSDDSMQGRVAGSPGNYKGAEYLASEAKRFGLQPAGTDGTFFQTVTMMMTRATFDSTATISVDGSPLTPWVDYLPRDPGTALRSVDGIQVIFGGNWADSTTVIPAADAAGKIVVITSTVNVPPNPAGVPNRQQVSNYFRNAAAIAIVALDTLPAATKAGYHQPTVAPRGSGMAPAYLYISKAAAEKLLGRPLAAATKGMAGKTVAGSLRYITEQVPMQFDKPLRNVVALLPGSDPTLRTEYVVIGAHNDHIGSVRDQMSDTQQPQAHDSTYIVDHLFRTGGADDGRPTLNAEQQKKVNDILAGVRKRSGGKSARMDSVFNGADDDGSGSVSLLEIAQYFAAQPVKPKRSILFVWHVGEERGLWGSAFFTDHPTVTRDAIVAELNMDMVGRGAATDQTGNSIDGKKLHGGPGYLQVVGSRRLSTELGDLAESVNKSGKHGLKFDYGMDANGHPQNIYCRSDHYEYARYGIPIAFFTTGGHADYHQLTDEPQYVDYNKMAQVDKFVADLAKHVANLNHRPLVDKPKPDPTATCRQ